MKKILPIVLLAVAALPRYTDAQPYIGGQFQLSRSECKGFEDGVAPLGLTATCDETDPGYRVDLGLHISDHFGVEVGYQDAGEGVADAFAGDQQVLTLTAPFKAWDAVLTLRQEWDSGFRAVARGGVARWDYEVISSTGGFGADNDGTTPTFGVGVEYKWLTLGYDAILDVGQGNLLDPTAPDIKQTIQRWSAGLKLLF